MCLRLHSSFTSYRLTSLQPDKDVDVPKPGCCVRAQRKETRSTLYIIEFITVIYINLHYLAPLCNLAKMNLSQPECWTRAMQRLKNRCSSLQQLLSWGQYTSFFFLFPACRDKHRPALQKLYYDVRSCSKNFLQQLSYIGNDGPSEPNYTLLLDLKH